jgi:hypothetical protein
LILVFAVDFDLGRTPCSCLLLLGLEEVANRPTGRCFQLWLQKKAEAYFFEIDGDFMLVGAIATPGV